MPSASRKAKGRRAAGRSARSRKAPPRRAAPASSRWSRRVMETSDAMDLEIGVFLKQDPAAIARSLKRSAETSTRRKTGAFQSAMSMLNFYINRAGKNLPAARKAKLEAAKAELRILYGREPGRN